MNRPNLCALFLLLSFGAIVIISGCQHVPKIDSEAQPRPQVPPESPAPGSAVRADTPAEPATGGSASRMIFYPTGDRATSTLLLEQTYPEEVLSGRDFQFELRVENLTKNTLT